MKSIVDEALEQTVPYLEKMRRLAAGVKIESKPVVEELPEEES